MNDLLSSIYYNTKNSASFSSIKNLFKEAKKKNNSITLKDVKDWLSKQITYTLHKPIKKKFQRNKIIVARIDEQWEADLVDMREFANKNKNNNYILTIIDCFSKFAWVFPIKTKTGASIRKCFYELFKSRLPMFLRTDKGKEFVNKDFQDFLIKNKINFFTSKDETIKCAIVERFNRTLKSRMFKYFTSKGTRNYLPILQDLVKNYNNSYHRSIKMRPIDVTKFNTQKVFENIYGVKSRKQLKNSENPKMKTGDRVRLQYLRKPFDKGYYPNWTDEIFTIEKVQNGDKRIVFKIKDYSGEEIEQKFYPEELQKITENLHRIEKVLKRRKRKGIKEVFVKWLNYPESYNSWIKESELTNIS